MKIIRDALHDNIELNDLEVSLLDTSEMQRLRGVRQLSLAYLVYPSATHTRFEHSLGTFHLTSILSKRLFSEPESQKLRIAALLHDIGHSAFSHLSERIVKEKTGKDHEMLALDKIKKGEISETLSENGISPSEIAKTFISPESKIISSDFGTDRMDYLVRDSHFTGVAYSSIDAERLLLSSSFQNGELMLQEKGVLAAESLLVSRYLMFSSVYNHHAVRITSAMLEKALRNELEKGTISIEDITSGTDEVLLSKMLSNRLAERISIRNLFKTAFSLDFSKLDEMKRKETENKRIPEIEKELSSVLGSDSFVICKPSMHMKEIDVKVLRNDGSSYSLLEESLISKAVQQKGKENLLIVACEKQKLKDAEKICRKFFSK